MHTTETPQHREGDTEFSPGLYQELKLFQLPLTSYPCNSFPFYLHLDSDVLPGSLVRTVMKGNILCKIVFH